MVQTLAKKPGWAWCYLKQNPQVVIWCETFPKAMPVATRMGWWEVARCAIAIGAFVAGNVVAAYKLKKLGGAWKAAKRILRSKRGKDRANAVAAVFGELTGISTVVTACGG